LFLWEASFEGGGEMSYFVTQLYPSLLDLMGELLSPTGIWILGVSPVE
jgi:hypothetical protein